MDEKTVIFSGCHVNITLTRHCEAAIAGEAIQGPIIEFSEMHFGLPRFTSFRSQNEVLTWFNDGTDIFLLA